MKTSAVKKSYYAVNSVRGSSLRQKIYQNQQIAVGFNMADSSTRKVALITGCSSGVGLTTAVLLAKDPDRRFVVYATMRNPEKGKGNLIDAVGGEAGGILGESLFIRQLDISHIGDQQGVVDSIIQKEGRIDILVNNAGKLIWDAVDTVSMEEAQTVFDTNFWGVVRMIRAVLPNMKQRKTGRIINITSVFGVDSGPFISFYGASKRAVEGLIESLAPILRLYNIWAVLVEPGLIATGMTKDMKNQQDFLAEVAASAGFDDAITAVFQAHFSTPAIQQMFGATQTPDQVAQVVKEAIVSEKPHLRYQTSEFAKSVVASRMVDPHGDSFQDILIKQE